MKLSRGTIKVVLEKRGPLTLRQGDYVTSGGEGSIYRASRTIVKLYTDPKKMQRDNIPDKIKLLSAINHKYIVAPKGLVFSVNGKPIGFYMSFIKGEPLPRIFTNDFRKREGFNDEDAKILTDRMRETVQFAHDKGATLVDANELNWIAVLRRVSKPEPHVIDVDSWAIDRWGATVIMPSIKDWHTRDFNKLSDWFSWGIITFQVFTGIHPYKGKLDGFRPGELERRMKENYSVFTSGVKLNHAVRDFTCIPGPLFDWYVAVFQEGERSIPPSPFETGIIRAVEAVKVLRAVITATGVLVFEKLFSEPNDPAIRIWTCGVILLKSGKLIDLASKRKIGSLSSPDSKVVEVQNGWLIADWVNGRLQCSYVSKTSLQTTSLNLPIQGRQLLRYENRLFIVTERGLTEIILKIIGKPIVSVGHTWGVMINATRWFDGLGIQDTLGATYIVAPFSEKSCAQIRVPELDNLNPIIAKAGNRFITIIAMDKGGIYHKLELTFDSEYKSYKIWQGQTDSPELNIAILPKRVCATIVDDGELDIFVPSSGAVNKIQDKQITADMILANWDNKVVYIQNGQIWKIHMK